MKKQFFIPACALTAAATFAVLTAAQLALAVMNVRLLKKISETDEEEPS